MENNLQRQLITSIFFLDCLFITNSSRTYWYDQLARGFSVPHNTTRKVRTLSTVRHPELIALYTSCLGSIVGFARLPCFGTLRSAISATVAVENYYNCAPVHLGKHLSRES